MPEEDLTDKIAKKYLSTPQKDKKAGRVRKMLSKGGASTVALIKRHPKATKIGIISTAVGLVGSALGLYFFGMDYLTKRQPFPIRNVMYQCAEQIIFHEPEVNNLWAERESESSIYPGGSTLDTKVESVLARFKFIVGKDSSRYEIQDQDNKRMVSTYEKWEAVQAGMSITGTREFCDRNAEIVGKKSQKFVTYTIIPERGFRNIEISMLKDEGKDGTFMSEVITHREPILLGWLWGDAFRAMTEVNEFSDTPNNVEHSKKLHELIREFNSPKTTSKKRRVQLIDEIQGELSAMDKQPIVCSYEDGFFDWLPQESSTYLFMKPSRWQRMKTWGPSHTELTTSTQPVYPNLDLLDHTPLLHISPGKRVMKLRVENHWDLWPGNYWLLNKLTLGAEPNAVRIFNHRNNGGYTISDEHGAIAKVNIQDFILYYGDDLLYQYYLDKNADGKIDEKTELIGTVLFRSDQIKPKSEKPESEPVTLPVYLQNYTFMAGIDWERRNEEFYLCYAIETFMVNELNRGFGKHSDLGPINAQRSSILLSQHLNVPNLSRALTTESSLVLKYDIRALLNAAGRNYIDRVVQEPEGTK